MTSERPVQHQLDAYNARDLQVFRPPATQPALSGKAALAEHYATHRFNLPGLHAELVNRIVLGNKVIDHERIVGVGEGTMEAAAVYEIRDGLISTVWFFNAGSPTSRVFRVACGTHRPLACIDSGGAVPHNHPSRRTQPRCKRSQPTAKECFHDCSYTHSLVAGRLRAEFANPRTLN
ncbi:MAG: nuclear transport factor 2 family protein [Rhodoferax sp.]|nr:nuclear transport factor 2 family protein [Rhodoferax sp.]